MQNRKREKYKVFGEIYPICSKLVDKDKLLHLVDRLGSLEFFPDILKDVAEEMQLPQYLGELARLEFYVSTLKADATRVPAYSAMLAVNPTLQLFENSWKNLSCLFGAEETPLEPVKGAESIIIWRHPASSMIQARPVTSEDLLVLKMALEELSTREVAQHGNIHVAVVDIAVIHALNDGIVTGPESRIKRECTASAFTGIDPKFFAARIFTLQWHITQACDLHCRHCYDRSQYKSLSFQQEIAILDDLEEFCISHNVHGQVTFTGGNPLLHPYFEQLYKEASDRGLSTAILGNPASRAQIERLKTVQPPAFYQVSLEGLEDHNDYMRGEGHFKKVLAFLDVLRELNVYSMVMLTLTKANMDQVLPLAEILRDRVDLFTFNRLSLIGEGANLVSVEPGKFPSFLKDYAEAVASNPCLGVKDNLLNVIYQKQKHPLFGGCTGYGCGAAFNFLALLADGTVHACRKFPSPLGSMLEQSFNDIYNSSGAKRYRQGAEECSNCRLNPVCRGCLAVSYGQGRDIFRQKDPYCFFEG